MIIFGLTSPVDDLFYFAGASLDLPLRGSISPSLQFEQFFCQMSDKQKHEGVILIHGTLFPVKVSVGLRDASRGNRPLKQVELEPVRGITRVSQSSAK